MFCNKCGCELPEGSSFCQQCGSTIQQIDSKNKAPGRIINVFNGSNSVPQTAEQMAKRLAEKSFIFGLCTIPLFSVAVGGVTMILGMYYGFKSRRLSKEAGIPVEKKAKIGIVASFAPFIIAAIVGIVYGIIAIVRNSILRSM